MTIKEQLKEDLTVALKAGDKLKVSTLRSVIGAVQTQEKSGKTAVEFTEEQVLNVLAKEAKKRLDTSEEFHVLGYTERAETEKAEAEIIQQYLPEAASSEDVKAVVASVMSAFDAPTQQDMGTIMKQAKEQLGASVDGKMLSDVVRSMLA